MPRSTFVRRSFFVVHNNHIFDHTMRPHRRRTAVRNRCDRSVLLTLVFKLTLLEEMSLSLVGFSVLIGGAPSIGSYLLRVGTRSCGALSHSSLR